MATSEDLDCLSSICQALREVITSATGSIDAESEVQIKELFSLMPQVFATDSHAGRTSQLLHACHPFAPLSHFLSPRIMCPPSLRAKALQCIVHVATCRGVTSDPTDRLKSVVAEQLREVNMMGLILNVVFTSYIPAEAAAGAEALFVLLMTIPPFQSDIRRIDNGMIMLVNRALQRPNAPQVQGYLAGALRLLSEQYADVLSTDPIGLLRKSFSALHHFDLLEPSKPLPLAVTSFGCCTSRRAAVLILETLTEVLTAFPTSYWAAVTYRGLDARMHHDDDEDKRSTAAQSSEGCVPFADAVASVLDRCLLSAGRDGGATPSKSTPSSSSVGIPNEASVDDVVEACWSLYKVVLSIEGLSTLTDGPSPIVFPLLANSEVWRETTTKAVAFPAVRPRLALLRHAVSCAFLSSLQLSCITPFMESFPMLCNLLVPERSTPVCMRESAVIVALMLAKCPAARVEVRRMVDGYETWASQLCGRIHQILRTLLLAEGHSASPGGGGGDGVAGSGLATSDAAASPFVFNPASLLVVDCFQSILNDGDQAQFVDMMNDERVAQALLHEQRRRYANGASPAPLDVTFIDAFMSSRHSGITQRARELSRRLALTVLTEATSEAFSGNNLQGEVSSSPDASALADATRRSTTTTNQLGKGTGPATPSRRHQSPGPSSSLTSQQQQQHLSPSNATPLPQTTSHHTSTSRYQEWVDTHLGRQKLKTVGTMFEGSRGKSPFRPGGAKAVLGGTTTPSVPNRSAARHADPTSPSVSSSVARTRSPAPTVTPLLDVVRETPVASDEYLSVAIMMHLPIRFGPHYNRNNKAAIRKVTSPQGLFVQPIRRNTQQSWSASDVRVGELHVIFIAFHKLSCQRIEEEIVSVDRHLVEMTKLLVTTPTTQRSRRWFLTDMVHDVLPKTELLLRDLLDLLYRFGVDDVVYQLSLIRVADEGKRALGDAFASAVEIADTAMPTEILRLSGGVFRDIIHSGNIVFAVQQLREHYLSSGSGATGGGTSRGGGLAAFGPANSHAALAEVDAEIQEVEHRLQQQRDHSTERDGSLPQSSSMTDRSPLRFASVPSGITDSNMELLQRYRRALNDSSAMMPSAAEVSNSSRDAQDIYRRVGSD